MSETSDITAGIETVAAAPPAVIPSAALSTVQNKVYICLPWQKQTNPITSFVLAGLRNRRQATMCMNFGDAFVAHSRNTCVDLFLASPCEWSFWLDDDMLVPFGNAQWFNSYSGANLPEKFAGLHAIDRLLSHRKTIVGGLYFGRHPHGAPMYGEGRVPQEAAYARKAPYDLIKPTRWVATGCLLVHRSVFTDISKRFPRLNGNWFSSSEHHAMDLLDQLRALLNDGPKSGEQAYRAHQLLENGLAKIQSTSSLGMGEDVQFCIRAKEVGHQPYVDMGLVCGHIGHSVYGSWNTRSK
jgi:hypothetical protein